MSKVLCVFPKDGTTEFLVPLFDELCKRYSATPLLGDPQEDDNYLEELVELAKQSETIIFLGHGSSHKLYGVNFNELILEDNVDIFRGRNVFLFACNSVEFINTYNLTHSLGFGHVPTSEFDAKNGRLHSLPLRDLTSSDIVFIQNAIVRIWLKTLAESDLMNVRSFYTSFSFYTNVEIVSCLQKREQKNFRLIADILYYLKTDMNYVD